RSAMRSSAGLKRKRPEVPRPPWFSFWLGGLLAVVLAAPLLAIVVHLLRPHGPDHEAVRDATVVTWALTAIPLLLVGGGVARAVSDGVHLERPLRWLVAAGEL